MESNPYRIQFTPLAFDDLDEIDSYISETLMNAPAAIALLEEMEQSINRLTLYPNIGAELDDPYLAAKGYRKLVVKNYLIFYLVDTSEKSVIIMRVLYGAREYRNLL